MGMARDRTPHRTPARGFGRPPSPPPGFSLSSRHLLGAPPGPRIAIPGPHHEDGCLRGTNRVDLFYLATSPLNAPLPTGCLPQSRKRGIREAIARKREQADRLRESIAHDEATSTAGGTGSCMRSVRRG